jgi:SAM-dependent methyltransferase
MKSWIDYWNSDHPIYVNDRHKALHAEAVRRDIARYVRSPDAVVLDHGCGEALYAETVAERCNRLILCEAAPSVRDTLKARTARSRNIAVVGPEEFEHLPEATIDLIVANSLVQYLSRTQLEELLILWRRKLADKGELVIADVIPPDVSPLTDALALLRFGWSGGFLGAAAAGLAKTALSDYRSLRATLGFSTYSEPEFLALLTSAGYRAERERPNFGHNQARMTFTALPA